MLQKTSLLLLAASAIVSVAAAAPVPKPAPQALNAFLDQHCVECHDADVKKGGLDLTALNFDLGHPDVFQKWERVYERVHSGEMPPPKSERPEEKELKNFLAGLNKPLIQTDEKDIAENGRVRSRRLTRTEYENSVHDLLGIDIPLKDLLPAERGAHGFETVAEAQQLSHHQLARYLDVADISLVNAFDRIALGDQKYKRTYDPKTLIRNRGGNFRGPELRNGESISWPIGLQFTGRMPATTVAEDGWYRIRIKQVRAINPTADGAVWGTLRTGSCVSSAPLLFMVGLVEATLEPRDLFFEAWIQKNHMLELRPSDYNLKRPVSGTRGGNISYVDRDLEADGYSGIAHRGIEMQRIYPVANDATVRTRLLGENASLKKLGENAPEALPRLVARFASRAFRRPVDAEQVAPYVKIGQQMLEEKGSLREAVRASYRAILCSPRFLTLVENPGSLDDYALASRLSYTFWVSMPDKPLLELARTGKLRQPEVLAAEVDRLLKDPKAERFIRGFTDQWLKLKEIDFTSPDTRQFPTFDPVVQESMLMETRAYFAELIQKDLSVTHLVDSDFAFLNGRLARHYKMTTPIKTGAGLQKVVLSPGDRQQRGGLVTQGAVLKVTADGTHTSPVIRGVFVNERILGLTIPPPPPGVPAIEPDIRGATTIREQLEKHRNHAACASCHITIDPPGFALESYDPVGVWRDFYGKKSKTSPPVNPSGITPQGAEFADLVAWQKIQKQRAPELARGFVRQFLTYSTGAPVRFSETRMLDEIVTEAGKNGLGVRSLIQASLASAIFQRK